MNSAVVTPSGEIVRETPRREHNWTTSSLRASRPFRDDWAALLAQIQAGQIAPVATYRHWIDEADEANRLLRARHRRTVTRGQSRAGSKVRA